MTTTIEFQVGQRVRVTPSAPGLSHVAGKRGTIYRIEYRKGEGERMHVSLDNYPGFIWLEPVDLEAIE